MPPFQSQAKFSPERAKQCVDWIEEVTGTKVEMEIKDQIDFAELLKDGSVLCQYVEIMFCNIGLKLFYFRLINAIQPGSVKKINTMKAPFKQVSFRQKVLKDLHKII